MNAYRWKRVRLIVLAAYAAAVLASNLWIELGRTGSARPGDAAAGGAAPPGATRLTTEVGGVRLSALKWAAREGKSNQVPVILLHGGPGQAKDFAGMRPSEADPGLPMMLARGRDVYAIDLPGLGESSREVADYSILAAAKSVLGWMEANGIAAAHVLGWSQGGGVALHMADLSPREGRTDGGGRVASVTLMGSIGMQETEGSRSYAFEHARYAVGDGLRIVGPRLVPSFGLIEPAPPAFTRFFSDSDQRPMRGIMERLSVPALVLHGRRDFLVPHRAAEMHARAIPAPHSHLIMTGGSHFVPFWKKEERERVAAWLEDFWGAHDARSAAEPADIAKEGDATNRADIAGGGAAVWMDVAPVPRLFGRAGGVIAEWIIAAPWWVVVAGLALLARRRTGSSHWAVSVAAAMVVSALIDYGVAWVGLTVGAWWWLGAGLVRARRGNRRGTAGYPRPFVEEWAERGRRGVVWAGAMTALRPDLREELPAAAMALPVMRRVVFIMAAAVAMAGRQLVVLIAALLAVSLVFGDPFHPLGELGVVLGLIAGRVAAGVADHLMTIPGRAMLVNGFRRAARFEFWPTWVVYVLLIPTYVRGALGSRPRHPIAFTACNPGIEHGGGMIGESKLTIMKTLRAAAEEAGLERELVEAVCTTEVIEPGDTAARVRRWRQLTTDPASGITAPTILKPVLGYRGQAVRKVSTLEEAERYFRMMPRAALVQPWHPGPGEIGVAWLRNREPDPAAPTRIGRIFSITFKEFAAIDGDGRRTLEQLITRHPRYRLQAGVFLTRLGGAGARLRIPAAGERENLGVAGNHCQGALFRDGAHLITPELETAIDQLAAAYPDSHGRSGGLDAIRIDIRYRDEAALKAGRLEPDSIVEMNGTTGESTNIYDPDKPVSWSVGVLRAQWAALYDLGRDRMRRGDGRPMPVLELFRRLAKGNGRGGSTLAD